MWVSIISSSQNPSLGFHTLQHKVHIHFARIQEEYVDKAAEILKQI
jgi:hypothetical protein